MLIQIKLKRGADQVCHVLYALLITVKAAVMFTWGVCVVCVRVTGQSIASTHE